MNLRPEKPYRPPVEVRAAVAGDLSFVNHLQDRFSHQVGYLPLAAIEKRIENGQVYLALENGAPACYVLGVQGYKKHPNVGIIFQAAVEFDAQRRLISTATVEQWAAGAAGGAWQLLCWCAQDIEANLFWQSLGFAALAWRPGSVKKGRIHILWTRHAPGISTETPLYIPEETDGGALMSHRTVKLFEPGQPWDARPSVDWGKLDAQQQAEKLAKDHAALALGERRVVRSAKHLAKLREDQLQRQAAFSGQLLVDGVAKLDAPPVRRILVGGKLREIPTR